MVEASHSLYFAIVKSPINDTQSGVNYNILVNKRQTKNLPSEDRFLFQYSIFNI